MGRMRLHTKRLKKFNQLGGTGGEKINLALIGNATVDTATITTAGITTGTITTATITTAGITTGNITTANVTTISGVTADINTLTADVKLVIPTIAYTGANVDNCAIYATGVYMYLGRGGTWKSGLFK